MKDKGHWTDESPLHFRLSIAHNFISGVEERLTERNLSHTDFAKLLGVSKSRISRVFKNPGNLTLDTIIRWCRALDMKPSVVVYEDELVSGREAPIHPDVFLECWKDARCPVDMWAFEPISNAGFENHIRKGIDLGRNEFAAAA